MWRDLCHLNISYRQKTALLWVSRNFGGEPIKRYVGWGTVKRKKSDEFKEKKKIIFRAKWLFSISQHLCISNFLGAFQSPGSPQRSVHHHGQLSGFLPSSLDLIREKEQPKQPRPQLTQSKMSSPLHGQRIGGLAKRRHGTVMAHTGGLWSQTDQDSNGDSIADQLCDLGQGIWPPHSLLFFSTKWGSQSTDPAQLLKSKGENAKKAVRTERGAVYQHSASTSYRDNCIFNTPHPSKKANAPVASGMW